MTQRLVIFLVLNFAALGLGGLFAGSGSSSDWYLGLEIAPWTPPGWVFGAAWTLIMICFSWFMAKAWGLSKDTKTLGVLFGIQWILNVSWNWVFFDQQMVLPGFIVLSTLTLLVFYLIYRYRSLLGVHALSILPYMIWLSIAISLNGYVLTNN